MRKVIEVEIFKNSIDVYNNKVHVGDEEVVYLEGLFKHNFGSNLDNINLDLILVNSKVNVTLSSVIKNNKFEIAIDKSCFKFKGALECQIRLIKGTEILYLNEAFKIRVVDEINVIEAKESFVFILKNLDKEIDKILEDNEDKIVEKSMEMSMKKLSPLVEQMGKGISELARGSFEEEKQTALVKFNEKLEEVSTTTMNVISESVERLKDETIQFLREVVGQLTERPPEPSINGDVLFKGISVGVKLIKPYKNYKSLDVLFSDTILKENFVKNYKIKGENDFYVYERVQEKYGAMVWIHSENSIELIDDTESRYRIKTVVGVGGKNEDKN